MKRVLNRSPGRLLHIDYEFNGKIIKLLGMINTQIGGFYGKGIIANLVFIHDD
jgi:hypothetical protein